jgi:hypothetical protein
MPKVIKKYKKSSVFYWSNKNIECYGHNVNIGI